MAELGPAGPADQLRLLLSNVQLIAAIFYSLNSPGLTDVSRERGCPGTVAACAATGLCSCMPCCHATGPQWHVAFVACTSLP